MRQNNILLVITQAENAGAQKALLNLNEYLKTDYNNVSIAYLYIQDKTYFDLIKKRFDVISILDKKRISCIFQFLRLRKIVKEKKIKTVVTYTHWSNIIVPLILIGINIKIVANKRGVLWNYPKIRLLEGIILKSSLVNSVICVSDSVYNEATNVQKIKQEKVKKIPNAILTNNIQNNMNMNMNMFKVLFVGRLHEQKGLKYLIKGFHSFISQNKVNSELIICGDGNLHDYVQDYVKNNDLGNNIKLLGNVDNTEEYYLNSHVLLSTSLWEGFPNVLLEGGSYCLPIIATDVDGNKELISHLETGVIIKKNDIVDVSSALLYSYNNYDLMVGFANKLKTKIDSNFSHKIVSKMYLEHLKV